MGSTHPRDSRGREEDPYYYNPNYSQRQGQGHEDDQQSGYQDVRNQNVNSNSRNSIYQPNNAANGFNQRTGRLYRPLPPHLSSGQLYYPNSPSSSNENYSRLNYPGPGLENPFVLAVLIAGMAGITLIIIVIISIWILRSSAQKKKRAALARKTRSNYEQAQGDDLDGGSQSKKDPQIALISELKEQQQQKSGKDGIFSFSKSKPKKGNILSKKPKNNIVIENKAAAAESGPALASPKSDSVPICTSEVSATIISYEKAVANNPGDAPPVRVLKETFV